MFADESSNSSSSSVSSSRATMFMIDNLLQKENTIRCPKSVAELRPTPTTVAPPSVPQSMTSSALHNVRYRESPPLSEALYRSLNVVNSNHELPEYGTSLETTIMEANTRINQLCSQPGYSMSCLDKETAPPRKRHRTDPENLAIVSDCQQTFPDRSTSPTNSTSSSLEDDLGVNDKKKKPRTCFTNQQLHELETIFRSQRYLPAEERKHVALRLQLTERKVKTWFQNRRMKEKRAPTDEQLFHDPLKLPQTTMMSPMTAPMTSTIKTPIPLRTITSHPLVSQQQQQHPVATFTLPTSSPTIQYNHVQTSMMSQNNMDYAYNAMMPIYGYAPVQVQPPIEGCESSSYASHPDTSSKMTSL